ncbi:MAG: ATP-binding protein [Lachnoclostridium sp.]|jgi:Cdc6-like AAA superfamily ATPase|nr:ATP-binding protein [Lachnoclostridium sp.]
MKYAKTISDIPYAFNHSPLKENEIARFYYDGTMEKRFGKKGLSDIEDIYEYCRKSFDQNLFLLMGHKGCGKSTELSRIAAKLKERGHYVFYIQCQRDLDMQNIVYTDLLILIGEALLKIAADICCRVPNDLTEQIQGFWRGDTEKVCTSSDIRTCEFEGDMLKVDPKCKPVLKIPVTSKTDLKTFKENRMVYRKRVSKKSGEWLLIMKKTASILSKKLAGKRPIIIFDDLDKLGRQQAWNIFSDHAAVLAAVPFSVIFTFPVALSYDIRFAELEGYYEIKTLPIIKIETMDGKPCDDGIQTMLGIIKKRADTQIFQDGVLDLLIKKTGGSLRDLFRVINIASKTAIRQKDKTISIDNARIALSELKYILACRIESKNYKLLVDIYNGNRQKIDSKEMLLEMMSGNIVLEYNGKRWHNVHPLIGEFLIEQGLVGK